MLERPAPSALISAWLGDFAAALEAGDRSALPDLFIDHCFWRDIVGFTWSIETAEGLPAVSRMLAATIDSARPSAFCATGEGSEDNGSVEGWFTFETASGRGTGHLRLIDGRCRTLMTCLTELKGFEERVGERRALGLIHGSQKGRKSWSELRAQEEAELGRTRQPYCVIIGGGQGGLALAARLRRLDVPTIVIDRHERPGDAWRKRYRQLCLHDPVWADHMPYLSFPDDWPIYTPKDKLGDWLEMYAKVMEINFWGGWECRRAAYDAEKEEWEVEVGNADETIILRPRQFILATGLSGLPNMPSIPGAESFGGELHHSSAYQSGESFAGKRCVIVGSNNSAHDICADLWEHGADVTMVQRSSTLVARAETLRAMTSGRLFSEAALKRGLHTEKADMTFASLPYRLLPEIQRPIFDQIKIRDADLYDSLRKVGFELDFGEDESGLYMKYVRRGSGYYINVGASELVASGEVKLRKGSIDHIEPDGLVFTDGSKLPADLIVFATGFGPMNGWAAQLISQEVADKVGHCWGLGSGTTNDPGPWVGELRNMWRPTAQPGLWFHGGNLQQSRFYSRALALQLKARMEGLATPVYRQPAAVSEGA
ncbi:NAD(P)/FAD-dependent oxidoreductase [Bosea sp. BK604]|uniref:NAD(P)-binding domain-containing protein n=1 Tax=Bosea sp. BK604 TaxID=2512180 RepID=UPI001049D20D|nr:NAD(P)/FAD-dependent oxidoreductase [Bosea sp. BK604]TCR70659.1 putative flavoprotein involved in K+ transport [Bosea sp. BK604]